MFRQVAVKVAYEIPIWKEWWRVERGIVWRTGGGYCDGCVDGQAVLQTSS